MRLPLAARSAESSIAGLARGNWNPWPCNTAMQTGSLNKLLPKAPPGNQQGQPIQLRWITSTRKQYTANHGDEDACNSEASSNAGDTLPRGRDGIPTRFPWVLFPCGAHIIWAIRSWLPSLPLGPVSAGPGRCSASRRPPSTLAACGHDAHRQHRGRQPGPGHELRKGNSHQPEHHFQERRSHANSIRTLSLPA